MKKATAKNGTNLSTVDPCTHSEQQLMVVDVVVHVAVADPDHSGHGQDHGHTYDHDLAQLSRDSGIACQPNRQSANRSS